MTSNKRPTYKKTNLPLTSSNHFSLLTSGNARKTQTDHVFLPCLKRSDPKISKSGSSKNPFPQCACYWYNVLRWMFFILCGNWKPLLFIIVYLYWDCCNRHVIAFFDALFWRKSVFYALSLLYRYNANTKIPKLNWLCFSNLWLHFF